MSDRELLELAAKAAGIQIAADNHVPPIEAIITPDGTLWNPLTDSGDALDLVVKLGMTVNVENDIGTVAATAGWSDGRLLPDGIGIAAFEGDPYAAARRAIVRAAAEIGRGIA